MLALGIDMGGSGIKAAPVNLIDGVLTMKRLRIDTPQPSTPESVVEVVARASSKNLPGMVRSAALSRASFVQGQTLSAANVDKAWIGYPAQAALQERLGQSVVLVNDADAAGLAELQFGAARGQLGTVLVFTLGTGLGSALFREGVLVPNTEFGHLPMYGDSAERYMTDSARRREKLSWPVWAARVNEFLALVDRLLSPDYYIFGGGVSKRHDKFLPYLRAGAPIMPAKLRNQAGIVGAALLAGS